MDTDDSTTASLVPIAETLSAGLVATVLVDGVAVGRCDLESGCDDVDPTQVTDGYHVVNIALSCVYKTVTSTPTPVEVSLRIQFGEHVSCTPSGCTAPLAVAMNSNTAAILTAVGATAPPGLTVTITVGGVPVDAKPFVP